MSQAHRRKKAPEDVRRRLVSASIDLAAESGPHAVTVEAVARRAGVSKGGFQHHFPTRRALLDAVFDEIWGQFQGQIESYIQRDDDPTGRITRAYVHTNEDAATEEMRRLSRASLALLMSDADMRRAWAERTARLVPDESADPDARMRLLLCRLASDGLWLADLLGLHDLSGELRAELMRRLDDMTRRT